MCLFIGCGSDPHIKRSVIMVGEAEIAFVWIPNGSFIMGSNDSMALDNEKPVHEITLDGFWMSETPVTNVQFAAFINESGHTTTAEVAPNLEEIMSQLPPGTTPPPKEMLVPGSLTFINRPIPANPNSDIKWWKWSNNSDWRHPYGEDSSIEGMDNHPVVQISWFDALAFSKWAVMSLPTEAQWEYAAKKGEVTNRREMNIWQGIFPVNNSRKDGYEKTNPVYAYKPNKIGLYDMAGNVWEWVADWYDAAYPRGKQVNPTGVTKGDFKVVRGGAFDSSAGGLRITNRTWLHPKNKVFPKVTTYGQVMNEIYNYVGFRCAQSVKPNLK